VSAPTHGRTREVAASLLGTTGLGVWLAGRLFGPFGPSLAWPAEHPVGAFLHFDVLALGLAVLALAWHAREPSRDYARGVLAALSLTSFVAAAVSNLGRYYSGRALAWDLGNAVQAMWRQASGLSMACRWYGDQLLWGDHGSFAFFAFAPLTHLGGDPATALLLAQSALVAAWPPLAYAAARALGLARSLALGCALAAAASRALANAAAFDFHPEAALPALLALAVVAHARDKPRALLCWVLLAVSLKEMAALVMGAACVFFALESKRKWPLGLAALAFAIAAFDIAWLPHLTHWPSYLAMNASAGRDLGLAAETTLLRALSTGLVGWLHPFAWFAGAPWIAAAGLSPKLAVKGIEFQYGFLWYPVGVLGAAWLLAALGKRAPRMVPAAGLTWAVLVAAVNAPLPLEWSKLPRRARVFREVRAELRAPGAASPELSVASDACSAPLLADRRELAGLCLLDVPAFVAGRGERWDLPSQRALERANVIVVDRLCRVHERCLGEQLGRAEAMGFAPAARVRDRYLVWRRIGR